MCLFNMFQYTIIFRLINTGFFGGDQFKLDYFSSVRIPKLVIFSYHYLFLFEIPRRRISALMGIQISGSVMYIQWY